jgi:quinol monooxygenase YgiN
MSEAVLIITVKPKPDASRERFLELARKTKAWLERQPGFLRYALFDGGDGRWTDVMTWASVEAMEAANEGLSEQSGGFEDLIESDYVSFTGEAAL